jgi:hypothetical protein
MVAINVDVTEITSAHVPIPGTDPVEYETIYGTAYATVGSGKYIYSTQELEEVVYLPQGTMTPAFLGGMGVGVVYSDGNGGYTLYPP